MPLKKETKGGTGDSESATESEEEEWSEGAATKKIPISKLATGPRKRISAESSRSSEGEKEEEDGEKPKQGKRKATTATTTMSKVGGEGIKKRKTNEQGQGSAALSNVRVAQGKHKASKGRRTASLTCKDAEETDEEEDFVATKSKKSRSGGKGGASKKVKGVASGSRKRQLTLEEDTDDSEEEVITKFKPRQAMAPSSAVKKGAPGKTDVIEGEELPWTEAELSALSDAVQVSRNPMAPDGDCRTSRG